MNDRRQFLGLAAASAATGGWLGGSAHASESSAPVIAAAHGPVQWWVDAQRPVARQAVSRLARPGEPVHALPATLAPDWAAQRLAQAQAQGAAVAGVASMADAFVLRQLALDAGWRIAALQVAPASAHSPALVSWRFQAPAQA